MEMALAEFFFMSHELFSILHYSVSEPLVILYLKWQSLLNPSFVSQILSRIQTGKKTIKVQVLH